MERINLGGESPEAIFLRRVLERLGRKKIANTLYCDVVFTINGVAVPFAPVIQEFAASLDEQAKAKAVELLSEAGLAPVLTALRDARVNIQRALKEVPMKK